MSNLQGAEHSSIILIILAGWVYMSYYYIGNVTISHTFVCILLIGYIAHTLSHNRDAETFVSFQSKEEKHAFCDTIEKAGKFCAKNNSKMCNDYSKALRKTKTNLNKLLLQANKHSFDGDATNQNKPKV